MPDIPVAEPSARYAAIHANFATHQALAGLPALVTSGVVLFTPSCVAHDETTIFTPCAVRGFLVNGELRSHPRGGERGVQLLAPARYTVKVSAIGESGFAHDGCSAGAGCESSRDDWCAWCEGPGGTGSCSSCRGEGMGG